MEDSIKIWIANLNNKEDYRKAIILDYKFSKEMFQIEDYWEGSIYPSVRESKKFLNKQNKNSLVLLAETPDKLAGYLLMVPGKTEYIYTLHSLYIAQEFRNSGLGEKLINIATKWAEKRDARFIFLRVAFSNVGALGLYKRTGFKIISHSMMKRI
jgi:ribosomal protein S18 acetylase RimI-like enzyme